ncbi:hypothetical protein ACP4OV_011988 [Aristida adscensionis]
MEPPAPAQRRRITPPPPPPPVPELNSDLIEMILLRLPPDDPALLFRSTMVCSEWRDLLTNIAFAGRYRALHVNPPLLGVLVNAEDDFAARFIPTCSFRPRTLHHPGCHALDARDGRVLFYRAAEGDLLIWDPITDEARTVPFPRFEGADLESTSFHAAVLCAGRGCRDRLVCHCRRRVGFRVAFVATAPDDEDLIFCCIYSSEEVAWNEPLSLSNYQDLVIDGTARAAFLGTTLYFIANSEDVRMILAYDMDRPRFSFFPAPQVPAIRSAIPVSARGRLLFAAMEGARLRLWLREAGAARSRAPAWVALGPIALPFPTPALDLNPDVVGFAERVAVFLVTTDHGLYTARLRPRREMKPVVAGARAPGAIPYTSFYTPADLVPEE